MTDPLAALRRPAVARALTALDLPPAGLRTKSPTWLAAEDRARLRPLLVSAAGDQYAAWEAAPGWSPALVYVGSEGQAALLDDELVRGLTTVVELPYWRDLLQPPCDLRRLRARALRAEEELVAEEPRTEARRGTIVRALGVERPDDAVRSLWAGVRQERFRPRHRDGAALPLLGHARTAEPPEPPPARPIPRREVFRRLHAVTKSRTAEAELEGLEALAAWAVQGGHTIGVEARAPERSVGVDIRTPAALERVARAATPWSISLRSAASTAGAWVSFSPRRNANLSALAPCLAQR